ncbi:ABC transporter permease subunit [Vibrio algivorus]|uniref:Phosphate ABC transporter permease n=1 Tax=Vibrio algivorus TaxID=1667024 RepID=A0ABQ6ESA7_9VIBR|nr:ABC transporter permease subunit [Vibrio algivorus]GLT15447.1 phosphate ABC transporter permease [Vibrio algivorus]
MAQVDTFFQQRDKRRWLTDRFASSVIKLGGISVLIALVLLIFYLIMVIAPIFSPATIKLKSEYLLTDNHTINKTVAVGIDDDGRTAFRFTEDGQLIFFVLNQSLNSPIETNQNNTPLLVNQIVDHPVAFKEAETSSRWYAYTDNQGGIYAVRPKFSTVFTAGGRQSSPSFSSFADTPVSLDSDGVAIRQFDFSIQTDQATFIGINQNGEWRALGYQNSSQFGDVESHWQSTPLNLPTISSKVTDFVLTPDGKTLYVLYPDSISVLKRNDVGFQLRETVALENASTKHDTQKEKSSSVQGVNLDLLPGAYSVLITQSDGKVSQWFDVLKDGKRQFTQIRDFDSGSKATPAFVLPEFYRKGFFLFDDTGRVNNFYTTSDNKVFSKKIAQTPPITAATSPNEQFLMTAFQDKLSLFKIDNPHPDITFTSLWQKVWYEGYPEPEFIWQSTAASNDFEAKFSLVPIAFGTLKSALFAMIFAVPISVCGAVYTAYFMTPGMRRYVKPTIELMEALPTVIIGFLAGLWLAPIVELNLLNTVLFIVLLPMVILLTALLWQAVRKFTGLGEYQGWIALFLVPVMMGFAWLIFSYGHYFESWLFGGDVRLFMANMGVDFDQRNALIVGFAMGFAVIPTIFTIAEDAIFSVPKHLSDGASALGATPWQCLTTVVLVTASPGIFSAVMMGLGRAVGETMIVLMATGNTPVMDWNIFEGMRTLSANIAIEMPESEVGSSHFRLLFLSAFLLFIFTFVVNSIAELIRQRLRDKYSAL